ncbi:MAG TPA: hypothetical protein VF462_16075 [Micromonosporaceae bacterium]
MNRDEVKRLLRTQHIEASSWAYGNSGARRAYRKSGCQQRIVAERVGGTAMGWGA